MYRHSYKTDFTNFIVTLINYQKLLLLKSINEINVNNSIRFYDNWIKLREHYKIRGLKI